MGKVMGNRGRGRVGGTSGFVVVGEMWEMRGLLFEV